MKKILTCFVIMVVAVICTSCNGNSYPIDGNTLIITNEYSLDENFSLYTLKYEDTRASGLGEPISIIRMKYDRNAFEVGDTIKLIKVEN